MPKSSKRELNYRESVFIAVYINNEEDRVVASEACQDTTDMNEEQIYAFGTRMLSKPHIQKHIVGARNARKERLELTADKILKKLRQWADEAHDDKDHTSAREYYKEINRMLGHKNIPITSVFNLNDFPSHKDKVEALNDALASGIITIEYYECYMRGIQVDLAELGSKLESALQSISSLKRK